MRLRVARKMDRGYWKRRAVDDKDKRTWWRVYTDDQLRRAEIRLRRSWGTRCPVEPDGERALTLDWFAANRVQSRRARQRALRKIR
jgi:hypothetical protein